MTGVSAEMHYKQGHSLSVYQQWLTTTGAGLQGMLWLSQWGRWRVSEVVPTSIWSVWLREGWKSALPVLSLLEKVPSDSQPSSALPKASKSFKLLSLCWVSEGSTEHTSLPQATRVSASRSAPSIHCVQPLIFKAYSNGDLPSWSRSPEPVCWVGFLSIYFLPTPLLSLPPGGWDGRRAWILINCGSAHLSFSMWSLLYQAEMVCSAVFRFFSELVYSM